MHWMLGFVLLHVTQVVLIIMTPELMTKTYFNQLCASTLGCSMDVGLEREHIDSMDPVCKATTEDELADVLKKGVEHWQLPTTRVICSGSRRCCSRCRPPLPTKNTSSDEYIDVIATDELHAIFQLCLGIMIGSLALQLLLVLIEACSEHVIKQSHQRHDETPLLDVKAKLANKEQLASRWKVASILCILTSMVLLGIEMCILIVVVLIPALTLVRNLSCVIYVVVCFVLVLAVYCCMGLVIEKYLALWKKIYTGHTCFDTCIWKAILSVMGSVLWLVLIAGFIISSVYCAIIATNIE